MWREARLRIVSVFAAPVACSILPAHPWVYGLGQSTGNGAYLSPPNAVQYLADRLIATDGNGSVIVLMVCANTCADFVSALQELAGVFPASAFTQVSRMAAAAAELETVKMQLPQTSAGGLPATVPLTVPSIRTALNARRVAAAQQEAANGFQEWRLTEMLAGFIEERASQLAAVASELKELEAGSVRVQVFTYKGSFSTAAAEIVKGVPMASAVYTAAMMLTGDNLTPIERMIYG